MGAAEGKKNQSADFGSSGGATGRPSWAARASAAARRNAARFPLNPLAAAALYVFSRAFSIGTLTYVLLRSLARLGGRPIFVRFRGMGEILKETAWPDNGSPAAA